MTVKRYQLNSPAELDRFNRDMKFIGLTIQTGLFGDCTAYLDEYRYNMVTKRKAGRPTVMTSEVISAVLQYRSEGMKIKEIAARTHVSKGVVGKVLKMYFSDKKDCPEGQIQMEF